MKKSYKPLSLIHLIVMGALVFPRFVCAAEPVRVEGEVSHVVFKEPIRFSEEQQTEAEWRVAQQQNQSGIPVEIRAAAGTEEKEADEKQASGSNWIANLGGSVASLGAQGKESVIKVVTSVFEPVREALNQATNLIALGINQIRSIIASYAISPQQKAQIQAVEQAGKDLLNKTEKANKVFETEFGKLPYSATRFAIDDSQRDLLRTMKNELTNSASAYEDSVKEFKTQNPLLMSEWEKLKSGLDKVLEQTGKATEFLEDSILHSPEPRDPSSYL